MKCELCHKADASEAIVRGEGDDADELYVCAACAKAEKERRTRKSQRTRKVAGLPPGVSMSITEISKSSGEGSEGDGEPPPFIGAIMDALHDMVSGMEKAESAKGRKPAKEEKMSVLPTSRAPAAFRVKDRLHLEGLHRLGELDAVKRAMRALGMELEGVSADGVGDAGHAYLVRYGGSPERAKRVVQDLLREEKNARTRLKEELPRVFGDSLCRALAILKNCRLMSPGELFDLLSPMRLAAKEGMLEGITLGEIERMMSGADLSNAEDGMSQEERDRVDAERADEMNGRFEEVMLNDVL